MFENNDSSSSSPSNPILNILLILLIFLVIVNVLYYSFGIDLFGWIRTSLTNFFSIKQINIDVVDKPPVKVSVATNGQKQFQSGSENRQMNKEQVFNIPGNVYDYPNAKALCNAYGGRLANYKEMEDAYQNGGEWCNYGWSEDQMALFPTQQKTYDSLQKIKGHEHDCGRPGINGGYIANQNVKFGVNCYGNKPPMDTEEEDYMQTIRPLPQTQEESAFQKNVDYWKTQVNQIVVAPFNYDTWSKF
jgi:hypothetical protein